MTRIVAHDAQKPQPVSKSDIPGDAIYTCACGLSAKAPFCDGSHKVTTDEQDGTLYRYTRLADGSLEREVAA